ncbi:sulfurtransferase complex subunit TusB [Aliamphritea spongicola]|uniref:sulfurtransferase complex subunit TusB n=1 Tax=Aliamphritea spongicola TaxID=707589 RepID=UPI00196A72C9|nr:sulfurtransferase complex subunit TusB [Aliamphritea spongicola]MBN3561247.1 sulfurtransferase complex subunit TusB [Aliamphritea spongicola]
MSLHTLNKAPSGSSAIQDCLSALQAGDALLLIEDGVYAALDAYSPLFQHAESLAVDCYVLSADTDARGLSTLNPLFKAATYSTFVELSCQHHPVVSWA